MLEVTDVGGEHAAAAGFDRSGDSMGIGEVGRADAGRGKDGSHEARQGPVSVAEVEPASSRASDASSEAATVPRVSITSGSRSG